MLWSQNSPRERVPDGRWDYVLIASASLHPSGLSGRQAPHGRVPASARDTIVSLIPPTRSRPRQVDSSVASLRGSVPSTHHSRRVNTGSRVHAHMSRRLRRHLSQAAPGTAANRGRCQFVHPQTQHTADAASSPCERRRNNARVTNVRLTHRPLSVDAREGDSADRLSALATRPPLPPSADAPPNTFTVRHEGRLAVTTLRQLPHNTQTTTYTHIRAHHLSHNVRTRPRLSCLTVIFPVAGIAPSCR